MPIEIDKKEKYKYEKLLSLLSLLTISGSAVPTTIAASPYQKEQTIRVKRQTQSPIFKTNGADIPTEQQIKDKLINKYPHIAAEQIKVKILLVIM
ncbi:hypothetical protein [Spiroplasma poulsonii]|uniref:Uncharacterized protein n=1 Tax=Spiroplasma poulsonii TaxID=2138 RepID=A0A2P6F8G5_9MOLU|nr:hypothetical protein [Spiroplasma poulsonii]PQM29726.1 hypothetical protein SMSRO_SF028940 [Spiroplasma poulsonii]